MCAYHLLARCIAIISLTIMPTTLKSKSTPMVINFTHWQEANRWMMVNDTVMGGVSSSQLRIQQSIAAFTGYLSKENNGGFASMRRTLSGIELASGSAIKIRVKGDGRRYQLRFRTDSDWQSVAYAASFATVPDQWRVISFTESDFLPVFRGRPVSGMPALDFNRARQIGFLIADKNAGEFKLEIDWISNPDNH